MWEKLVFRLNFKTLGLTAHIPPPYNPRAETREGVGTCGCEKEEKEEKGGKGGHEY